MDDVPHDALDPDWSNIGRVHEWKRYIDDELVEIWDTFNDTQKKLLAQQAERIAGNENWD